MLLVPVQHIPILADHTPTNIFTLFLNIVVIATALGGVGLGVFGLYQFWLLITSKADNTKAILRIVGGIFLLTIVNWGANRFLGVPDPGSGIDTLWHTLTTTNLRTILPTPVP